MVAERGRGDRAILVLGVDRAVDGLSTTQINHSLHLKGLLDNLLALPRVQPDLRWLCFCPDLV